MTELESTSWGKKAQIILQSLDMLQPDLPTILILRHSAREEPPEMEKILSAPLTESGRQGAEEFGQRLPPTWSYTLQSSPVGRCQDTATHIQKGLEVNQIEVKNKGIMDNLHYITVDPIPFMQIFSQEGMQFLRKWIDGQFPTNIVEPAINVAQRAAIEIKSQIFSQDLGNLNVYITHDFQTILFLYYWGKIDAMTEWIPYLNGFILQFSDSSLIFMLNGNKHEVPYPDWWVNP